MGTPLHIALRYLFARKSHNVINIISIISAAGIAIGSMALILILSVYNGFDNSIKEIYESFKADFVITPTTGKKLEITPQDINRISAVPEIGSCSPVLEENIYVRYGDREAIATVRGIEDEYLLLNHIQENIIEGEAGSTTYGEIQNAIISQPLARTLGLRTRFLTPIEMYYPKKSGAISITNPLASVNTATFSPSAVIRTDGETDANILYAGMEAVKKLTETPDNYCTALEIYLSQNVRKSGISSKVEANIKGQLEQIFPDCSVKDKMQQNSTLYKMMKAEKFAVYLILFFIIAIISINIFNSLSMLITDKREDISTFLSMGAERELVQNVFHLHGFLISFIGCIIGIAVGLILAFIQQQTGIISIPGNYLISAYPVEIQLTDIAITFVGVCATGYLISGIPVRKFFKN